MWSLLSVLTVATGKIPAFQLAAMTFAIGAAVAFASWIRRPAAFKALRQPLIAWAVGVGGLFGYHALYFLALRFAPPAEAGLLNYLWPLLIVLFSSLLPGERLAPHHIIGALLGLAGTVLLFAGNSGGGFAPGQIPGLAAAFVAAFVWAAYSVMSRKLKAVPTDAVAGFCLATAVLAALVHGLVETTVWPETTMQWLAIIALGIGPVGAAFFAWDIGMKRGDIRVLGAASYATPLLSTSFLILAGFAKPSASDRHRRDLDRRRRPDCGQGYGLEALSASRDELERFQAKWIPVRVEKITRQIKNLELRSDSIATKGSRPASNPSAPIRTWQSQSRAQRCIRPASSRRCFLPPATRVAARSPAALRRPRDRGRAGRCAVRYRRRSCSVSA